ncbi:MAG TPA: hypothetical protein PLP82_01610 [Deltaproteobacteria bacterium]|jgi:hypothetical protein|nr:hypothetical protein [Deltaproteobacteria bacterium]OQC29337.1 MAG: hypothetical protein BWX71_00240 [Deltaproteobacteria bacterium ADurb.Bin072]HRW81360.1 hypothetical protein [Desulfomonilia bacterium]HNQ85039.1 hypothetical protein [Deltaproteobacteria bacterium]HNS89189.1 hypothetical protein [Deltaproteobacteria bacterium]
MSEEEKRGIPAACTHSDGVGFKGPALNDEKKTMAREKVIENNRRRHERKDLRFPARVKISLSSRDSGKILKGIQSVIAMAETKNISIGGMSLRIVASPLDVRKSLTPAIASHVVGRPIEVVLEEENMVIWGDVIRTESNTLELAIVIYKVSDVREWKKICSESAEGISIFPDSQAVRKKRRS